MDYAKLAATIYDSVGGKANVKSLTHCATRLRFNLVDDKIPDEAKLKATEGVVGVVRGNGQFQIIIGSDVANVYRPLSDKLGLSDDVKEADEKKADNKNRAASFLAVISGIFVPLLPVITAAGMIKAVLSILVVCKVVVSTDQNYQLLNFIGDAGFFFLPVFLGATAAKQFKTNMYLGMLAGAILVHPTFVGMVNAAKEAGSGLSFFGLPITLTSYSSTVIPVILSVLFMSYVERIADRISPKQIKFFSVPLITMLITALVTLTVLGPLGAIIGNYLGAFFKWLDSFGSWLVPTIVGAVTPFLVMTGSHYGLVSIGINNRMTLGYDTVASPGMLASNVAQGGAALAIALKTKNINKKALATSAGITAVCGITEPALYGVTLQNKAALIGTTVAGTIGGLFIGLFGARNFAGGSPGLLTLTSYIGDDTLYYFYVAAAALVLSVAIAFVVTLILYRESEEKGDKPVKEVEGSVASSDKYVAGSETTTGVTGEEVILAAPADGELCPLSSVNDPTFAAEMLGKGYAVKPESDTIVSPLSGKVTSIFPSLHAVTLESPSGLEVLVHVGLDTVNLQGQGFKALVAAGSEVKVGTPLLEVDLEAVKAAGYDTIIPVVITNSAACKEIGDVKVKKVAAGSPCLRVMK